MNVEKVHFCPWALYNHTIKFPVTSLIYSQPVWETKDGSA